MDVSTLVLAVLVQPYIYVSGLVLPMTKSNGDPDVTSIISHMTLMEQTVNSLQTQVQTTNTELITVKGELKMTKEELKNVIAELKVAETDIAILKQDRQKSPYPAEFANLKKEFEALKISHGTLMKQVNITVIESVSTDVKSNMRDIQSLTSELLTTRTDVNKTVYDIQTAHAEVVSLSSQILELNQSIHDAVSESNVTEQELAEAKAIWRSTAADVKMVQTQVNKISGTVTGFRQEISANKSNDENVAFQATYNSPGDKSWTTLKFDTVDYNNGNSYNQSSGMFTAPVPGSYIFWANVLFKDPVGNHDIYIYKEDQKLATGLGRLDDSSDYAAASIMVATHLNAGDQVHFTTDSTLTYISGHGYSSYGGALLHTT